MMKRKYLNRDELEEGRVYLLHSRNLTLGVWRPEKNDFVGIRLKFDSRFLDSEYYERTAFPTAALNMCVPDEIPLVERNQTIDTITGRPVDFDTPVANGGRGWFFLDGEGEANQEIRALSPTNKLLFEFLDRIEKARKREEFGQE